MQIRHPAGACAARDHLVGELEDAAGHLVSDDNGGLCYSFTTETMPEFFTEIFQSSDNDLDNLSLRFFPDGSGDYYRGCNETITSLPVDPAGGTPILQTVDDAADL